MRRFVLFSNNKGYGPGLAADIDGDFHTLAEAVERAEDLHGWGHLWQEILDTATGDRDDSATIWSGPTIYRRTPTHVDTEDWYPAVDS